LADDYSGQAAIGKLNADKNSTSQALGVTGIPSILFMRNGQEVDRVVGAVSSPEN